MSLFLAHSTTSRSRWWWVENLARASSLFMLTDWYTWATCFSSLKGEIVNTTEMMNLVLAPPT